MRRERWMALAALPVLLLAGDIVYWRFAAARLRAGFDAWTLGAAASGWTVRHGAIGTGGWPDMAVLRVEDVEIAGGGKAGRPAIVWGAGSVILRTRLLRPDVLEITPVAPRDLRLRGGPPIPVAADHARLRLVLRPNAPPSAIDLDIEALQAVLPDLGILSIGHLTGHAEIMPAAERNQVGIGFALTAGPVTLPDGVRWGLGPEVAGLAIEGAVNGPLPGIFATPAVWATAWRDGGGSVDVRRLAVHWGASALSASATLALDEDLQPMGAGTGKIAGYGAALDALAANAVIGRSAAKAAKAVLSLLASPPADGQPEEVEVPMTLQFRTLSVRQVPLARLPELNWSER